MERLTKRVKKSVYAVNFLYLMHLDNNKRSERTLTEILEKLANYEDLEEKAGCELSTVFHEL